MVPSEVSNWEKSKYVRQHMYILVENPLTETETRNYSRTLELKLYLAEQPASQNLTPISTMDATSCHQILIMEHV